MPTINKQKPLTKKEANQHWFAMLDSPYTLNKYCRKNGVLRSVLILAVQKFFPEEWEQKKGRIGPIITGNCNYCGLLFYANVGGQKYCDGRCARNRWVAKTPAYREAKRVQTKAAVDRRKLASQDEPQDSQG